MILGGPIVISQRSVKNLVLIQSVLSGLQVIAGASILGDVITPRWAALFIVLVAGLQTSVNTYISKSVGEAVMHVDSVVSRAEAVTDRASDTVTQMAASLPATQLDLHSKEGNE